MTVHVPPCPGPEAHVTKFGHPSCAGHVREPKWVRPGRPVRHKGEPCLNMPKVGQKVCSIHGGKAPQNLRKGARVVAEAKIQKELAALLAVESLTEVGDPLLALSRLAAEVGSMKSELGRRVNALTSLTMEAGGGTDQLRAEVVLYERALDRTARLLDMLVRSRFEEKRIALSIAQGDEIIGALRRIFVRLALSEAQQVLVGTVVPEEIRAIATTRTEGVVP